MKNLLLKNAPLFFSSFLIFMLHLPFVFANTKPVATYEAGRTNAPGTAITSPASENDLSMVYSNLELNKMGLSEQAFNYALKGYDYLKERGKIINDGIISIVDFTKPSSQKRLFIIDLKHCKTLFNTYVAHGQGSGEAFASKFSNIPESYQSSLGFYITSDTYIGKNGYSMRLNGIEAGINDKADERAIVLHGAPYVCENFIKARGYIGRSWGCPAVPENMNRPIIETIKNGTCLFIYSENKNYLTHSKILNS